MKKLQLNLKNVGEILSREKLKQIFGGSEDGCNYRACHCLGGSVGSWTGYYCSDAEVTAAVVRNCASKSGACTPN